MVADDDRQDRDVDHDGVASLDDTVDAGVDRTEVDAVATTARLTHENIIVIHEADEHDGAGAARAGPRARRARQVQPPQRPSPLMAPPIGPRVERITAGY